MPALELCSGSDPGLFLCMLYVAQVCGGHGRCLGTMVGYCECDAGYSGAACVSCQWGYIPVRERCIFAPGALATCSDGMRNGQEDGVDCGGSCATACLSAAASGPVGSKLVSGQGAQPKELCALPTLLSESSPGTRAWVSRLVLSTCEVHGRLARIALAVRDPVSCACLALCGPGPGSLPAPYRQQHSLQLEQGHWASLLLLLWYSWL